MKKNYLPKKSEKEIIKILKKRKFEDLQAIQAIEKFFIKKRGYIFKMPPKKNPVILLFSGGLDSTITWALLMEIYQLVVYPLVRISPESGNELKRTKKVVRDLSPFLKKKYPKLFREPFYFQKGFSVSEIKKEYTKNLKKNKKELLKFITSEDHFMTEIPDFMTNFISPALQYKNLLRIEKKEDINTIFFGLISSDGEAAKAQTLTSLKSIMFNACNTTQNYKLQISSLAIEKELGYFLSAKEFIRAANKINLPLEYTWSCLKKGSQHHCGKCFGCGNRQFRFSISGIKDKTIYLNTIKNSFFVPNYRKYVKDRHPLLHKLVKYVYNKNKKEVNKK